MSTTLIIATTSITLALIFYTLGVWAERKQGTLQKWHLLTFWVGLLFDATGTMLMGVIADGGEGSSTAFAANIHGITGLIAVILMLFHATWATYVIIKNDDVKRKNFHKFSLFVWIAWLVPYLLGMYLGMTN